MIITEEAKKVIENASVITLVTVNADGTPHPIIAGKGAVNLGEINFGIYKMNITQENLKQNKNAWVVAGTKDGAPKGFRFSGIANAKDKHLIFTVAKIEELI
jgi:general stress protein 26